MQLALLIDFGSTYTKLNAVDMDSGRLAASAKAPTTVQTSVMQGLKAALVLLEQKLEGYKYTFAVRLASSSAAGGLRMCAIGLVPTLTLEAARMAALGSGAKLVGHFAYEMDEADMESLVAQRPDIVLLAGGTDGGNKEVLLHNARMLAHSPLNAPIVMAGNRSARAAVQQMLAAQGKTVVVCENVLPELNRLNIDPVRLAIRELFISHITHSKGVDEAESFATVLMPTPVAVLQAARLLAQGTGRQQGLGDLMVVDIGGATTDVHSIGYGTQGERSTVTLKGIPEPYDKRTVEGDLGVRHNAAAILETVGVPEFCRKAGICQSPVEQFIRKVTQNTDALPATEEERRIDLQLARCAANIAVTRHVGYVETYYSPMGMNTAQYGKDLTQIATIIGTGGPLVHLERPSEVLKEVLFNEKEPERLRPKSPAFFLDRHYILYAVGLLAQDYPGLALRLAHGCLQIGAKG